MEGKTNVAGIPGNNAELVAQYGAWVADRVSALNSRSENGPDILQSVWERLIRANVVEKFHARYRRSAPWGLTTAEVALQLGIGLEDWLSAQSRYLAGDLTIPWMPSPMEGTATSLVAIWSVEDVTRYAEMVGQYHVIRLPSDRLIPVPTVEQWRTYLHRAIHNAWANWCRTRSRRHKERVMDSFKKTRMRSAAQEDRREDPFDTVMDTSSTVRRMEAAVTVRQALRALSLGSRQESFLDLLGSGYTAVEAAEKLGISVCRVQRVLNG